MGWTGNFSLSANPHARNSNVPTLDHLATPEPELEAFARVTLVKHLLVGHQSPLIIHIHLK